MTENDNDTSTHETEQEMLQVWDMTEDAEFESATVYRDGREEDVLVVSSTAEQLINFRDKLSAIIENKSLQPDTRENGIELVRCTRGHTVKRGRCTGIVGQLVCPICECKIPGHSVDTDTDPSSSDE